jgi:hypothetical protein
MPPAGVAGLAQVQHQQTGQRNQKQYASHGVQSSWHKKGGKITTLHANCLTGKLQSFARVVKRID